MLLRSRLKPSHRSRRPIPLFPLSMLSQANWLLALTFYVIGHHSSTNVNIFCKCQEKKKLRSV